MFDSVTMTMTMLQKNSFAFFETFFMQSFDLYMCHSQSPRGCWKLTPVETKQCRVDGKVWWHTIQVHKLAYDMTVANEMSEEAKLTNQLSWAIRSRLVVADPLQRQSSADKKASWRICSYSIELSLVALTQTFPTQCQIFLTLFMQGFLSRAQCHWSQIFNQTKTNSKWSKEHPTLNMSVLESDPMTQKDFPT